MTARLDQIRYSSELAALALGLTPTGAPYPAASALSPTLSARCCAMCRRPILTGAPSLPLKELLNKTFLDFGHLLVSSDVACGWCAVTSQQSIMRFLQRSLITTRGIYSMNTDAARAWFWLTPPEPPFALIINHTTLAAFHFFWRTPVTVDAAFVQMNVDDQIFQVRRSRVLAALKASSFICAKASFLGKKNPTAVLGSPFQVLMRSPKRPSSSHGHLSRDAEKIVDMFPECRAAADYLSNLSPGELLALAPLLKSKPEAPLRPALINSITQATAEPTITEPT